MNSQEGHLKRWMEDATQDAVDNNGELNESELSDLQAWEELAALEKAAREALLLFEMMLDKYPDLFASKSPKIITTLRSALKAL